VSLLIEETLQIVRESCKKKKLILSAHFLSEGTPYKINIALLKQIEKG